MIRELLPECKIVHGKARHTQSQGSVERVNQEIKKLLGSLMRKKVDPCWVKYIPLVQLLGCFKKTTFLNINLTWINSCCHYYEKPLLEIWAQVIDVCNGRFRFEIVWLLHNSIVCISKSIGVRLNICINIK